jgi:hypothetical protein
MFLTMEICSFSTNNSWFLRAREQLLDEFMWNKIIFACTGSEPQHYLRPGGYLRVTLVDSASTSTMAATACMPQIHLMPMGNGVVPEA